MATEAQKYEEFDKKLLSHIETGTRTAKALSTALESDARPMINRTGEEFRVVERRLQALRKKGVIAWRRLGSMVVWNLTS